jgi:hypothetical protein
MERIHKIITKCIEVLDPTIKVKFCPITGAAVDLENREILLPDWREELYHPLMSALHELAHLWYERRGDVLLSGENLSEEEMEALLWINDAYVDYHFCKDLPEFSSDFRERYLQYQEEFKAGGGIGDTEFWHDLSFTAWEKGSCYGLAGQLGNDFILELQGTIDSAKSTIDLIPVARKLVLLLQARGKPFPRSGSWKRAENELKKILE